MVIAMLKYVLFDVDGTLTDPAEGIVHAICYALPRMGLQVPEDPAVLHAIIGPPLQDSFQRFFRLSPEEARRMLGIYREYYGCRGLFEAYLYDGIRPLLADLQGRGIRLCVATSKPIEYVTRLFDHFDLHRYFTFLAADDLACSRHTKSEVIRYLLENFPDITPENAVMVGDRRFDVIAAREFGLRTVGCAWGHAVEGELEEAGAAYIVRTADEARELLLSL